MKTEPTGFMSMYHVRIKHGTYSIIKVDNFLDIILWRLNNYEIVCGKTLSIIRRVRLG